MTESGWCYAENKEGERGWVPKNYLEKTDEKDDEIYNTPGDENNVNDDKYFNLHQETMDTLHFYVFHLYQGGLRHQSEIEQKDEDTLDQNMSPYFDAEFQRMCMYVKRSRGSTNRFNRLHGNKFDISAVSKVKDAEKTEMIDVKNGEDTFLDYIYNQLLNDKNFVSESVVLLCEILQFNGYDTESLDIDVNIFETDQKSTISSLLDDNIMMTEIVKIFTATKSLVFIASPSIFL